MARKLGLRQLVFIVENALKVSQFRIEHFSEVWGPDGFSNILNVGIASYGDFGRALRSFNARGFESEDKFYFNYSGWTFYSRRPETVFQVPEEPHSTARSVVSRLDAASIDDMFVLDYNYEPRQDEQGRIVSRQVFLYQPEDLNSLAGSIGKRVSRIESGGSAYIEFFDEGWRFCSLLPDPGAKTSLRRRKQQHL